MAALFSVVCLTETWLTTDFFSHKGHIDGSYHFSWRAGLGKGTHLPYLVKGVNFFFHPFYLGLSQLSKSVDVSLPSDQLSFFIFKFPILLLHHLFYCNCQVILAWELQLLGFFHFLCFHFINSRTPNI